VDLQSSSIDDCLEPFDLLMVTELLGKAQRETNQRRARQHPRLARASAKLAVAVEKLLDASASGESLRVEDLWEQIETVVARGELRAALTTVEELAAYVDEDDEADLRARLAERSRVVSGFIKAVTEVIEFGSNAEGAPVLEAMRRLPGLVARRRLNATDIDDRLVHGSWRRLVYGRPAPADGRQERLQLLRADPVSPASQTPRHLRTSLHPLARPARTAARWGGVGQRQGAGAQGAGAARASR
jgi:hypothetical protein